MQWSSVSDWGQLPWRQGINQMAPLSLPPAECRLPKAKDGSPVPPPKGISDVMVLSVVDYQLLSLAIVCSASAVANSGGFFCPSMIPNQRG